MTPFGRDLLAKERDMLHLLASCPHVARVLDFIELPLDCHLVLERADGDVFNLASDGALPQATVERVALHVGIALKQMHAIPMVHRDVKPENILYRGTGDEALYILSDFGFPRGETAACPRLTWCKGLAHGGARIGATFRNEGCKVAHGGARIGATFRNEWCKV